MIRNEYVNITKFETLEEAQIHVVDTILKNINSYEIIEKKVSEKKIKWILNIYKGEVFSFDDKPTLMEYKVPYVAEFVFIKNDKWIISGLPDSIEELESNFSIKYKSLIGYLEKIILEVSWDELLNIAQIENAVTPFYDIIRRIVRTGKITYDDIRELEIKRNKSFKKYISLLEQSKIIESNEGEYTLSNISKKFVRETDNSADAAHKIVAYFISQSALNLIHGMRLYPLKSYVFLENAYYIPTLQMGAMEKMDIKTYERSYRKINQRRLGKGYIYSLYKLDEVGLIELCNDKYLLGVKDKYNKMNNQYNTFLSSIS